MKQHLRVPWTQILIACTALVMAFGIGTSVQADREAAEQRETFRRSLQMLDQYLWDLSEDLGDPDILALEAPLEDGRIQESLARVRRTVVALKESGVFGAEQASARYPHACTYLFALEKTLLGSNYPDPDALSQVLTVCRPLREIEAGLSCEEAMTRLEENIVSGDYQDALDLLGMGDLTSTTTQGGT